MKASLAASCVLGALLLAGCSANSTEQSDPGPASAAASTSAGSTESATPAPAVTGSATSAATPSPTPAALEAPSKDELEARVTALTDVLGNPFQLVSADQAAAALETVQAVMENAEVQPPACKDHATGNMAASGNLAAEAVSGIGSADESGGVLAVVLLDGSTEEAVQQGFQVHKEALEECSEVTVTIQGTTITSTSEELPLDRIGEESFALLMTQESGSEQVFQTLSVTARGNGVIATVQAMSQGGLDGITQDQLAGLAAQLLEPSDG